MCIRDRSSVSLFEQEFALLFEFANISVFFSESFVLQLHNDDAYGQVDSFSQLLYAIIKVIDHARGEDVDNEVGESVASLMKLVARILVLEEVLR